MEKREIIYGNILPLIKSLTPDSNGFEAYYETKDDDEQSLLLTTAEEIETEYKEIRNSKLEHTIHSDFEKLVDLLADFQSNFSDFENQRINEILLLIELINKLNNSLPIEDEIDLTEDINVDEFAIVRLHKPIFEKVFIYHDNENVKNSLILFDLENIPEFHDYLENNSLAIDLNYIFMSKIGDEDTKIPTGQHVLIKDQLFDKPSPTWSCVALHLLKEGYNIHEPYHYSNPPSVNSVRKIESGAEYQQFNDTLIILSEYNHQKDILDKYLRLYHVLENFMYKYPLVKLERKHNGEVFSIRDFQRMFDKINTNELSSLTKLFQRISTENIQIDTTFEQYIFSKFDSLHPSVFADLNNLNKLFRYLRFTKKRDREIIDQTYADITQTNIIKSYATILYSVRNSIVHNRETEFHLTHEILLNHSIIGDTARLFLENFLIPTMEEIVFYLIIERNEIVWFENSKLILWEE